jgi:putative ABC transport system permease protein
VDHAYPLLGEALLEPADRGLQAALQDGGAVVEEGLLARLDLRIGDAIRIGEAEFEVRAVLVREPDRIGGFVSIGPRVMIGLDRLPATRVIQPGSLARYGYRFALPEGLEPAAELARIRSAYPEARWRTSQPRDVQPRVTRIIDRLSSYLTIAGLASLLIGGVGIALAIQNYLAGKTGTIAILKCLGASSRLVFLVYLAQVLSLAAVGIAAGLLLGQGLAFAMPALTRGLLPVELDLGFHAAPLLIAAGAGFLTALAFAIWPLAQAREVSAAGMFRALLAPPETRPPASLLLVLGLAVAGLAGLALIGVNDKFLALIFIGAALAAALLLTLLARLLLRLARTVGRRGGPRLRMALANLNRPGAQAASVVVALGAGLTVLTLVAVLNRNLLAELDQTFEGQIPAVFFIDIQPGQREAFIRTVDTMESATLLQAVPVIRGRVVRIKGVPADQSGINHWTLRRDRNLSYAGAMPEGTELVAGDWWPADYQGPPLVSIEDEVAEAYGVTIGDRLGFNVLGRVIEAEIRSLRKEIDWSEGRIDFVFLFSPGVLEAAPSSLAAAVDLPADAEPLLLDQVAERFPNVTPISMREVGARIGETMGKIQLAVLAVAGVTLLSGVLVLAGAVAAARRRHRYEAAVLKVLGARRAHLLGLFALEYLSLGAVAAAVGGLLGMLAAWITVTFVMEIAWVWAPGAVALVLLLALALTFAAGFTGTWRLLGRPAAPVLRTP